MSKGRNFGVGVTAAGLLLAAGAGASFPFWYAQGAVKVRFNATDEPTYHSPVLPWVLLG